VRAAEARVRRSLHLVLYWRRDRFVARNYATATTATIPPEIARILDFCSEWRTPAEIAAVLNVTAPLVSPLIRKLVDRTFLERSDRKPDPRERAMSALDPWNPEAGFFHTATKTVKYVSVRESTRRTIQRARELPMPSPVKRYRGAATIDLPRPDASGEFARVALQRRTWRRFSKRPVTLQDLATVLGLSAGVQQWVRSASGDVPLKTSPSGGARHPIELYVVVRNVEGLRAGLYHYAAGRHGLTRIGGRVADARIRSYVPSSGYFAKAPVMVFFTAVFARQLWRYSYSRAYRAALIEAGHVCQTFCLSATSLELAPYCLMGLADALIEHDLKLDGVTETVLYAAGLGVPPRGADWAPLPSGQLVSRKNPRL
jgi:SagB-type dehydrogenase family enzyme